MSKADDDELRKLCNAERRELSQYLTMLNITERILTQLYRERRLSEPAFREIVRLLSQERKPLKEIENAIEKGRV